MGLHSDRCTIDLLATSPQFHEEWNLGSKVVTLTMHRANALAGVARCGAVGTIGTGCIFSYTAAQPRHWLSKTR